MEIIYYTLAALILYGVSDWILNTIEIRMGKRLTYRSAIFFAIILTLSMLTFAVIRIAVGPQQPPTTPAPGTPAAPSTPAPSAPTAPSGQPAQQ